LDYLIDTILTVLTHTAIFSLPHLSAKTTLIPLDLTHQFLATHEIRQGLLFGTSANPPCEMTMAQMSNVRRLYYEIVSFFAKTYDEVFGLKAGPPTHDPLAVFAAFRGEMFFGGVSCLLMLWV
jgi:uridine nucleosidase